MNYFRDSGAFIIKDGRALYNKKGTSYLDKAINGLAIEDCYNEDIPDPICKIIEKKTQIKESSSNLEKCSCITINKKKFTRQYVGKKISNKKKRGHRIYKNFDIDNVCSQTGLIGCGECEEHYDLYDYDLYDYYSYYSEDDYYDNIRDYYDYSDYYDDDIIFGFNTDVFDISVGNGYNDY